MKNDPTAPEPTVVPRDETPSKPNTRNEFFVGQQGDNLIVLRRYVDRLTFDDALNLAAYLVALADGQGTWPFADVLEAVKGR